MHTIVNRSGRPLQVHLSGDKMLHLGPGRSAEITDATADYPAFRKLVDRGWIEILGEDSAHAVLGGAQESAPHGSEHGHPQPTVIRPSGNR